MILQTAVLALLAAPALSAAYRDEAPLQKWSPEYFQYRFFPAQSTYKRRMPSYVQVGWKVEGGRNVRYCVGFFLVLSLLVTNSTNCC